MRGSDREDGKRKGGKESGEKERESGKEGTKRRTCKERIKLGEREDKGRKRKYVEGKGWGREGK